MAGIFLCAPSICADLVAIAMLKLHHFSKALWLIFLALGILVGPLPARAVTPESPEVRELIDKGLKFIETSKEGRSLGGKCLIALTFLKEGAPPTHPIIVSALEACRKANGVDIQKLNVYSNGLAIIFLAEINPGKHRELISRFAGALSQRQKTHGGWGYSARQTGDTSQTQYAALSYWELAQIGMIPKVQSVEACTNWLLRTQDPNGAWGYQGIDAGESNLVEQQETSLSMVAAGLGSAMILGNVLGLTQNYGNPEDLANSENTKTALSRVESPTSKTLHRLSGNGVDRLRFTETVARGQKWFQQNFSKKNIRAWGYPFYLLYSIERYKSFEELQTGDVPEEPSWYQVGYEHLRETQKTNGSWSGKSRPLCSTAFAILFLGRSTQKSIRASLGEGTLVGGRGLHADLSKMKLQRGRLITEKKPTEVDALLVMLEKTGDEGFESLLNDPDSLRVSKAGPEEARRLQQIVKSGVPVARLLSVRALAQLRDLDYVPTLLYAMTDPDQRVVREARDGLRFVSRRFGGFGLPDNFTDTQRYDAIDKWKNWYRQIRPDAPLLR